jgi:hypothetical protein
MVFSYQIKLMKNKINVIRVYVYCQIK